MKIKYIALLLFVGLLSSCKQENNATAKLETMNVLKGESQDIEVYDLANFEKILNQSDDKIHVVNFWATWCGPCIKEIPHFEKVNEEMENVEVVLASIDQESDFERLTKFVNKKAYKSDVIVVSFESNAELGELVGTSWSGENIPVTVIYNKHKRKVIAGSVTHDELVDEIEKFKL